MICLKLCLQKWSTRSVSSNFRTEFEINPLESDFYHPTHVDSGIFWAYDPGPPPPPPPPQNFQVPPWWGYGYFLEPHNKRCVLWREQWFLSGKKWKISKYYKFRPLKENRKFQTGGGLYKTPLEWNSKVVGAGDVTVAMLSRIFWE